VHPRTNRLIVVSAIVVVALFFSACSKGDGGVSGTTAATAGSTQITDEQVAHEAKLFTFIGALNQSGCGQPTAGESAEAACNRFALSNLIQGAFVREFADQNDVTVTDQALTAIIASLDQQLGADKVDQQLQSSGLTRDDLNELGREVLLFQDVQKKLGEAGSTDAQLKALYQQQILDFTNVGVEHILVKTQAEAQAVYKKVTAPGFTDADFEALAKDVSIDPSAKTNGGKLPSSPASGYVAEFGQAAAALAVGEVSKPVKTQYGWHVIKLLDKTVTPFDKAKSQLVQSGASKIFNDWLTKQAQDQGVEVNPKYGRYDIPTLTVVAITSTDPSATGSATGVPSAATSPTP
jgi:parvulin-like peptidyl-prolyl isomerase